MDRVTKGYIKFTDKKCVMKPFEDEGGVIETWVASEAITNRQWFVHNGRKYQLVSTKEKE
jgi:hypothetical protein